MTRPDDGGSGGGSTAGVKGVSKANPAQLNACAQDFTKFTNVVLGIGKSDTLQSGGEFEKDALKADDADLGASTTDFQESMAHLSRAFLEVLMSAAPQLADVAIDLEDCAGDFVAADSTTIPAGAIPEGNGEWYDRDTKTPYYRDSEGHIAKGPVSPEPNPPPGPAPTPTPSSAPTPSPTPTPSASPSATP